MRRLRWLMPLAVGVLLAEGILALAIHTVPEVKLLFGGQVPRYFEDEQLSLRPNERHPDHDARGFRNVRALARADVVVLGDSNAYGSGVRREEAWPQQLDAKTHEEVYNMAFPGWGPGQALLVLDEALALAPRLVIEAVYPGNDLRDVFHLVYNLGQLPDLLSLDDSHVEALRAAEREDPIRQRASEIARVSLPRAPETASRPGDATVRIRSFLGSHSRIYQLLGLLKRQLSSKQPPVEHWSSLRARCRNSAYCVALDIGYARTLFTPEYRLIALDDRDPRVVEGERIFLACLLQLRDRVRSAGARFLVVWIPTKETVFAPFVEGAGGLSASFDAVVSKEESLRLVTLGFLDRHEVPVVDVGPVLRQSLARGSSPYPESTDGHPNPLGHRLIAEKVASQMGELLTAGAR